MLGMDADDLIMDEKELDALLEAYGIIESNHPLDNKRHGHYCWKCGHYRANEKFSGKGHAKHICKTCQKVMCQHARQKRKERLARQDSSQSSRSSVLDNGAGNE
jgi:hypothetical protein